MLSKKPSIESYLVKRRLVKKVLCKKVNKVRKEDGPSDDNHIHRDFAQDGGFLCPSGK